MISVSCVKMSFKPGFWGKKRSQHVYKMHRRAVEHDDGRLFITRELRRRSLSYSRWYIDIYLHYIHTTRRENVIARARWTIREFRMPLRPYLFQNNIDRWLLMTFQINYLSTYNNYTGDELWTFWALSARKKVIRLSKSKRDVMAIYWLAGN